MRRGLALFLCVYGWVAAPAALASGGLYKWVDDKGVVHYSDTPPVGKAAKKLGANPQPLLDNTQAPPPSRSWQEQLQESNERRFQEEKRRQDQQKKAQETEDKCRQARRALESLTQERPLYRMGKDGERIYMEDDERGRFADTWQKQADAYCR
ncbi:MAG: DUF4124 domain-containing protein [Rhodocyclaceae bacterium]|jgi:hypothetical protein|nr:DUF4124 domain-containing protein [Rhodocyclaceae bacterium]MBZ0133911.1 DUF4124 domain-containing protein [Rhodocyclaceae bacterium]PKO72807.1 MAG: hypothetical protein CVU20_00170 [Betaproteobacteria bacterium HGW-Betaproteobacteria-14]